MITSVPWDFVSELVLVAIVLAMSQYVAVRAGVFSLGTVGFAGIGAYTAGLLVTKSGWPWPLALVAATVMGLVGGLLLGLPISRLRGVYQGIATLAFVVVAQSIELTWKSMTNGPLGLNAIPRTATLLPLAVVCAVVVFVVWRLDASVIGYRWTAVRDDEFAAVAIGLDLFRLQLAAVTLSGGLGALGGGLIALNRFSITPATFGFPLVIATLATVYIGGYQLWYGPVIGAALLTVLPEILRPFAEYRQAVNGAILITVMILSPRGIAGGATDTIRKIWNGRLHRKHQSLMAVE